jgi:hypothetical protein
VLEPLFLTPRPAQSPLCIDARPNILSSDPSQTKEQADHTPVKKTKKNKTPIVESAVRRSPRLRESNRGFKPGACTDRRCLACTPTPPDLPLHLIKVFGMYTHSTRPSTAPDQKDRHKSLSY